MRILIDILHPAHVHFFRNFIREAKSHGHSICVTARDKEMTLELLRTYQIEHLVLTRQAKGSIGLAFELIKHSFLVWRVARKFQPDLMIGIMAPCIAIAGLALKTKVIAVYDNESAKLTNRVVYRLVDAYITPVAFTQHLGPKQVRYSGYHELAYLHPNYFAPNVELVRDIKRKYPSQIFFVRFVGWWSSHDRGEKGFSLEGKRALLDLLSGYGTVILSSEAPLPKEFKAYESNFPASMIHHVLVCADLFVGESSTMASEAAILGCHSIYISKTGRGVNDEQARLYRHAEYYTDRQESVLFRRLEGLLNDSEIKNNAKSGASKLVESTIDITQKLLNLADEMDNNNAIQNRNIIRVMLDVFNEERR